MKVFTCKGFRLQYNIYSSHRKVVSHNEKNKSVYKHENRNAVLRIMILYNKRGGVCVCVCGAFCLAWATGCKILACVQMRLVTEKAVLIQIVCIIGIAPVQQATTHVNVVRHCTMNYVHVLVCMLHIAGIGLLYYDHVYTQYTDYICTCYYESYYSARCMSFYSHLRPVLSCPGISTVQ